MNPVSRAVRLAPVLSAVAGACALALALPLQARVTRIELGAAVNLAPATGQTVGMDYEQIPGIAHGEIDPRDPLNAIIQDIELVKSADGKVRYAASFVITRPKDPAKASGMLWHDVPNRGGSITITVNERNFGDYGLASAWQGDNSGNTAIPNPMVMTAARTHFLQLPIVRNPDGSSVTGQVFGRIVNRTGASSQPLVVQGAPLPYLPASLDSGADRLVTRDGESTTGVVTNEQVVPRADWKWASCTSPQGFEGASTPDGRQICVKGGFDPKKLYMVTFKAKDPLPLGVGFAAWRDVGHFFKTAQADDFGTANPLAGKVSHSIARGNSQSGNFLRGWLHLGFNQAEDQRQVHDGMWPIIAGRRIALNFRWAQPDGVLELYQAGSEGPQWWAKHPDQVRGLPPAGILDRCDATKTCPKVIEHFGSAEVWALKLTPEWVGTDAKMDIPLPKNVRRYYIASSTHGGSNHPLGPFNGSLAPQPPPSCPGNNFGTGLLPSNPLPHVQTVNALRVHFRNWVMQGTLPPDSVYPTLNGKKGDGTQSRGKNVADLVEANKAAMGFPTIPYPGMRATIPEADFIMPVLDYDWGPLFDYTDASGIPTNAPPPIKQVIKMLVPRVDADGNEIGGVPAVLNDAPLGTYLGWNITSDVAPVGGTLRPFHKGQICDYTGGMIPFAKTRAERLDKGDPRLSLQERYGSHDGYVAAVRKAAAHAVERGFLLQVDADALIVQAQASNVLLP